MKKLFYFFTFISIHISSFAQCEIPLPFIGNTGGNMTLMLTPNFINSLPEMSGNDYLVATTPSGLVVGSIYWIDPDPTALSQLSLGTNVAMAIWGDDTATPEVDGAAANEPISFQLVVGNSVYFGDFPTPIAYSGNGMSFQTGSPSTDLCIPPVLGCMDATASNFDPLADVDEGCIYTCSDCPCEEDELLEFSEGLNTGTSMNVLLDTTFISSLPSEPTQLSYILAVGSSSGIVGGGAMLASDFRNLNGMTQITIWADDLLTPELDGLQPGEQIDFIYYDGPNVYTVDLIYDADGNGEDITSSFAIPITMSGNTAYVAGASNFHQSCEIADFSLPGCTNPDACNFNEAATDDDGSCLIPDECNACVDDELALIDTDANGVCDVYDVGCTDPAACNYNQLATADYDACIYSTDLDECASCSGEIDGTGTIVDNDADDDGVCNADELEGCKDVSACNYNDDETLDTNNDLCIYASDLDACATCSGETDGTGTIVDNDADDDGVCDADEIVGCEDVTACNFNSSATDSDGSCIYSTDLDACASCSGETDGTGTIVDNDADDDGVCDADEIEGCTDASACNYDATPTTDTNNGLCIYSTDLDACASCSGETDGTGTIVDNDADDDGVCDADEIEGCTDSGACNYDATPTTDTNNDLCIYSTDLDACASCSGETDGTGTIVDNDADDDGLCDAEDVYSGCTDETACNYNSSTTLNTDNSTCIYSTDLDACATCSGETDGTGTIVDNDADDDGVCDADEIAGCEDVTACNYNSSATDSDGSCIYSTDLDACASCSGEQDGTGVIVDNDSDNDGICDQDEAYGCIDPLASNYNPNISPTDADNSCIYDMDYSDSLIDIIDSLDWEVSVSSAHIMMLQNQITNLEQQLELAWIINDENEEQYAETLSNLQEQMIEIENENIENSIAYFQSLISIDEIGPYEVVVQAYMILAEQYEECNPYVYGLIENYLELGWNMVGYNVLYPTPVEYQFASIIDDVVLVKNNAGDIYWPYYNFNAIGDMIPGQGYQVRVSSVVDDFKFVE